MRGPIAFAASLMFLTIPALAMAQEETQRARVQLDDDAVLAVITRAVDDFIRPGYRQFHQSAAALQNSMAALCTTPSKETYAEATSAFDIAVTDWARIEIVRVGPVLEQNRFERILYYPDRKSIGLKQVQGLLAKPDESATSPQTLSRKSVAMQGFGALEFVLSGSGSEVLTQEQSFRCRYGAAIAENIANIAGELVAAWESPEEVQAAWKAPGPDNPVFRNSREAITALLGILVHGAEAVRDQRIETFYRGPEKTAFPRQALFWRSGNTWTMIEGNLSGLNSLLHTSGMETLLQPDQRWIVDSIDFVLKSLTRVVGQLDGDIEAITADEEQRSKLDFLRINAKDLIMRLNDDYGGAIGLGAGFSFSDGD